MCREIVSLAKWVSWDWFGSRSKCHLVCDKKDWLLNPLDCIH